MYLCFDERLVLHWTDGRYGLCGRRDMMEEAHPQSLDGTEERCKTCEKLKKKAARITCDSSTSSS